MTGRCPVRIDHPAHHGNGTQCPGGAWLPVPSNQPVRQSWTWNTPIEETPVTAAIPERDVQYAAASRAEEIRQQVDDIKKWWLAVAEDDADVTAPKAVEYGSSDLAIMGKAMEGLFPGLTSQPPDERERIGLEMAVAFYVLGKAARLFGAYEQGKLPADDSWFDLTVYSLMARRVRQTGKWV